VTSSWRPSSCGGVLAPSGRIISCPIPRRDLRRGVLNRSGAGKDASFTNSGVPAGSAAADPGRAQPSPLDLKTPSRGSNVEGLSAVAWMLDFQVASSGVVRRFPSGV